MNLLDAIYLLWRARVTVAFVVGFVLIASIVYVSLLPEIYQSRAVLVPVDRGGDASGALSRLGGLASIAGISIPSQGTGQESIAILRSRDLLREFIEENSLVPVLFPDRWDSVAGNWKNLDSEPPPDVQDAISLFDRRVRSVVDDKKNGLIILSIRWRDPVLARDWAEGLTKLANRRIRSRSLAQAEQNVKYLSAAISDTNVTAVQQALGRVLESELQKELLAKGSEEFAFRVIDSPEIAKKPVGPRRILFLVVALLLGMLMSFVIVILRDSILPRWRASRAS